MAAVIAPYSLDTELKSLLQEVEKGKIQLPEFQRGWTWDDDRIRGIIASLTQGYPMGAIMRLQYGNPSIRFKCRMLEGVKASACEPEFLILDGQQRLTSIFRATCSPDPVETRTEKKKDITRYYYLDMNMCLARNADRFEAVVSIPGDRKRKKNFDREVTLDLSTRALEYEHEMFPLNIIFDSNAREDWADGYKDFHGNTQEYKDKYKRFRNEILDTITGYKLPVITLDKTTPRAAVCKVFENVNTGGVALTVFELVTASFATYDFDLRKDWERCREVIWGKNELLTTDIMYGIDETAFLTAITLYTTYHASTATTCKKDDVLALSFADYQANKAALLEGYQLARKFLFSQYIFRKRDLPYVTQLIPLAAICAVIGKSVFNQPRTAQILSRWYWCGVLGEMYGGANETRYANDMEDVLAAINNAPSQNRTINAAFFSATRLLTLQTRLSAAYKGIMALIYKECSQDFLTGTMMDVVKSMDEMPDIHHIFPEAYCKRKDYPRAKYNSIVNKTPLLPASNRSIGGDAPSEYSKRILKTAGIDEAELRLRVKSNLVDFNDFMADDFDSYFVSRAKALLNVIEKAMGKSVADRDSEQTREQFGHSLA